MAGAGLVGLDRRMLNRLPTRRAVVLLAVLLATAAHADAKGKAGAKARTARKEFSATVVRKVDGKVQPGSARKLLVGEKVIRFEPPEKGAPTQLFSRLGPEGLMLVPERKEYFRMNVPPGAGPTILEVKDPAKPCAAFGATSCERVGPELVNGRKAVRWKAIHQGGGKTEVTHLWLDAGLSFLLRIQVDEGPALELTEVKVARQPKDLLDVPEDYTLLNAGGGDDGHGHHGHGHHGHRH
jgi:hypothetical protein